MAVQGKPAGKGRLFRKRISLKDITIPVYMLAGEADDITPPPQVFNAVNYLGAPKDKMTKRLVAGGHIGLFMGRKTLETACPEISRWILTHENGA
jgi:poly(3-hydroxybutyrate) depolymerase